MRRDYIVTGLCVLACASANAAEPGLIQETIVTAQRVEENVQEVPVSVSAFSGAMLHQRQILGILDVQMFTPNLQATETNFGPRALSIRGVGQLTEPDFTPQNSVSYHVNQVPFRTPPLTEFFDLERLEVLRGPQGTLFGRNSTAGSVNAVTRRPKFAHDGGYLNVELGNLDLTRISGATEFTFNDQFAIRVAGVTLDRDGYIKNKAHRDIAQVDADLDGRDLFSLRITPEWRPTQDTKVWLLYEATREDDDRVRVTNQICKTNPLPTTACVPDVFGLEPLHPGATSWGFATGLAGLVPLGARDASNGLNYDFPRPTLGIRDQHTDFEAEFEFESDTWTLGFEQAFASLDVSVLANYYQSEYLSLQDRFMDVGYTLNPTFYNPSGNWPTSRPPRDPGDPFAGPCPLLDGAAGVFGGCIVDADQSRFFSFDQAGAVEQSWSLETKLSSRFDGPLNFLLGIQHSDTATESTYYQPNNAWDAIALFGFPAFGVPPQYPSLDGSATRARLQSSSLFGELYWHPREDLKLTLGLRYSDDKIRERQILIDFPRSTLFPISDGQPPQWIRTPLLGWLGNPGSPSAEALALTDHYGLTDAVRAATSTEQLLSILQLIPPSATFGESQALRGYPDEYTTEVVTGRLGLDWAVNPDVLLYAFYSRGQNPGGFNGIVGETFADETVNAFEVGAKSLSLDGTLMLNVAAFYNAYDGLHIDRRDAFTIAIDNADADTWGVELEARWQPRAHIQLDVMYSWLKTKVADFESLDILNLTQGDPDLVLLRSPFDFYVAERADIAAIVPQALADGAVFAAPGTSYADGIPVYFPVEYAAAAGVSILPGVPVDLNGKQLPTAPQHSVSLGLQYQWQLSMGSVTARWDYYWQDKMYARVFNTVGDKIDAWDQHNASVTFETVDGQWSLRGWVRNLEGEDNVSDHYVFLSERAGPFRNYFLTEPRVYGATLSFRFGQD